MFRVFANSSVSNQLSLLVFLVGLHTCLMAVFAKDFAKDFSKKSNESIDWLGKPHQVGQQRSVMKNFAKHNICN